MSDKIIIKTQICKCCVMDTTDPNIIFDHNGVCNHCNNFQNNILPFLKNKNRENKLAKEIEYIKKKKFKKRI